MIHDCCYVSDGASVDDMGLGNTLLDIPGQLISERARDLKHRVMYLCCT